MNWKVKEGLQQMTRSEENLWFALEFLYQGVEWKRKLADEYNYTPKFKRNLTMQKKLIVEMNDALEEKSPRFLKDGMQPSKVEEAFQEKFSDWGKYVLYNYNLRKSNVDPGDKKVIDLYKFEGDLPKELLLTTQQYFVTLNYIYENLRPCIKKNNIYKQFKTLVKFSDAIDEMYTKEIFVR